MNLSPDVKKNACRFLFVLSIGLLAFTADPHPAELQGEWTISREAGFAPVRNLDEQWPANLTGSELRITHRNIHFQDRTCNYRIIERGSQSPEEFLRRYQLDQEIRVPGNTEVLQLDCDDDLKLSYLLTQPRNLWFVWYGVLLEATKL